MTRQKEQGANKEKKEPQQQDDDTHITTKDGPGASAAVASSQDTATPTTPTATAVFEESNTDRYRSIASFDQLQFSTRTDLHIAKIDDLIRNVALRAVGVYILLVIVSYLVVGYYVLHGNGDGDSDSNEDANRSHRYRLEYLNGVERMAPMAASVLLATSLCTSFIPMTYRMQTGDRYTGVLIGGFVVQFLAFVTNFLLCCGLIPVPVVIDHMTGMRVFLLRWCEWAPLAFVMTFMTEVCRVDEHSNNNNNNNSNSNSNSNNNNNNNNNNNTNKRVVESTTATTNKTTKHNADNDDDDTLASPLLPPKDDDANNASSSTIQLLRNKILNSSNGSNNKTKTKKKNNTTNHNWTYTLALCQGMSTFCGWMFPFITNTIVWIITMIVSFSLFLVIYYRLYKRYYSFQNMKQKKNNNNNNTLGGCGGSTSLAEQELHQWAKLSLGLLTTCTVLWTVLVVAYFCYSFGPLLFPNNQFLKTPGIVMACESIIDVLFKSLYLVIIVDVHNAIFDPNARTNRRLTELRQMMNTVWENSSDVIALSTRKPSGDVTTLFSPTFLKMYSENGRDGFFLGDNNNSTTTQNIIDRKKTSTTVGAAFVLEAKYFSSAAYQISSDKNKTKNESSHDHYEPPGSSTTSSPIIQPSSVYEVEFGSKKYSNRGGFLGNVPPTMKKMSASIDELRPVADLVVKAWRQSSQYHNDVDNNGGKSSQSILHDLVWSRNSIKESITCEANITRLEENALVIVVRNVSERFRRFEAEKKVVAETTARIKDAAANRFTRHEVKNGLLAAIGLCDGLKESLSKNNGEKQNTGHHDNTNATTTAAGIDDSQGKILVKEMDKTLHEILDSVLSEAMARDVIHNVYEPKLERVDIVQLIESTMKDNTTASTVSPSSSSIRFPLRTEPAIFPVISTDPQLIKYIHRNAMSNACKYGKRGGKVTTEIKLDAKSGVMCMNVINLPGKYHDKIVKLGDKASDIVFSPSRRLPIHIMNVKASVSHSSGDGAWVMLKCANTLGGDCDIKFLEDKTVFTFRCVITPSNETFSDDNPNEKKEFKLPSNLHAIAIDDSKIQRKLLARYFTYAGLSKEQVTILGDTVKEITDFENSTRTFIENHPDDYILLVVDENLDVYEDLTTSAATISGSTLVSNIRQNLLPDDERRTLALIRSANDSADDVAIYNSRAHGCLPKSPIKPGKVLEGLAPHWLSRFPPCYTPSLSKLKYGIPEAMLSGALSGAENDELAMATDYLKECITFISELMSLNEEEALNNNWLIISEKLQLLKGDLLTLSSNNHNLSIAVDMINDMRGPKVPHNVTEKWEHLKSIIFSGLI